MSSYLYMPSRGREKDSEKRKERQLCRSLLRHPFFHSRIRTLLSLRISEIISKREKEIAKGTFITVVSAVL